MGLLGSGITATQRNSPIPNVQDQPAASLKFGLYTTLQKGLKWRCTSSKAWRVKGKFRISRRLVKSTWGEKPFKPRNRTSSRRKHFPTHATKELQAFRKTHVKTLLRRTRGRCSGSFLAWLPEEERHFMEASEGFGNSQKAEVAWLERKGYAYTVTLKWK